MSALLDLHQFFSCLRCYRVHPHYVSVASLTWTYAAVSLHGMLFSAAANNPRRMNMSYKTILVHVDETRRAVERIRLASHLALAENAHLSGIAFTGISRFLFQGGAAEMDDPSLAAH